MTLGQYRLNTQQYFSVVGYSMIICHCNFISKAQIDTAIEQLKAEGNDVTVPSVMKRLGIRFKCGGCLGSYRRLTEKK